MPAPYTILGLLFRPYSFCLSVLNHIAVSLSFDVSENEGNGVIIRSDAKG